MRTHRRLAEPSAAKSKAAEPIWQRRSELVTSFDEEVNGLHNSLFSSLFNSSPELGLSSLPPAMKGLRDREGRIPEPRG